MGGMSGRDEWPCAMPLIVLPARASQAKPLHRSAQTCLCVLVRIGARGFPVNHPTRTLRWMLDQARHMKVAGQGGRRPA